MIRRVWRFYWQFIGSASGDARFRSLRREWFSVETGTSGNGPLAQTQDFRQARSPMARPRKKVPPNVKSRILLECGNKCANPGCFIRRVEVHHIRQWAVWGTNDGQHLVALCPTCHDAAHHGTMKLDDAMLYHWKTLPRAKLVRDIFHVEPGASPILFVADSAVRTQTTTANVVDFSESCRVIFRIDADDFFLIDLKLIDNTGASLLSVKENRAVHSSADFITYESRPGLMRITTTAVDQCVPSWLREEVAKFDLAHAWDGAPAGKDHFKVPFVLFEMEVVAPSQVRITGAICSTSAALFADENRIYIAAPNGCCGVSGYGQFILGGERHAFCASPGRASYYVARGGAALFVPEF